MLVALGNEYAGLFANDDGLAGQLTAAGQATGDQVWRFPLGDAYAKMIDSQIADIKNTGPRYGGSITAAQFIKRFVDEGGKWAQKRGRESGRERGGQYGEIRGDAVG